jgi:purine-cytosine permease-like protein
MRRTGITELIAPLLVVGVVVYALLRAYYGRLPLLNYLIPVPIAALAIVEYLIARRVRALLRHDSRPKPMTAVSIARCTALGKASALVGAGVAGAGGALLARVAPESGRVSAAAHDLWVGGGLVVAALLLAVAGLLLERAGVDPGSRNNERGDDRPQPPSDASGPDQRS